MPIYEYRCTACGHELEALQKLSDAPLHVCPACQKPELKKLVSAAGFQLKGSGWYVTDFRGGKGPPKEKPAAGDAATSGNGNAAAPASDGGGETRKSGETRTDKPATGAGTESKPATPAPSTTKSDA